MLKNILIVEDEILIANQFKRIIESHGYHCAGIAISYAQAAHFLKTTKVDGVLIDVNIFGDKNGIDVAKLIQQDYKIPFVYVTSYTDNTTINEIMLTGPKAYLVKPINDSALTTTLDLLFCNNEQRVSQLFDLKDGNTTYRINLLDLYYVESNGNYLKLFLTTERKVIRSTIKHILEILPLGTLFQINRRVAVNPTYISEIRGLQLILTTKESFKISPLRKKELPFTK